MTELAPISDPAAEWRSAQLLYGLYTALAREFAIDLPPCTEFEIGGAAPAPESVEVARVWLRDMDRNIPVHQLRHFLQTSSLANEECLRAALDHHLHKPQSNDSDRDKTDFLLVQFFSLCAQAPLEDSAAAVEYVARILEPFLGTVELVRLEGADALEELIQNATACSGLEELFSSGILEKGRKLKFSSGQDYFAPAALVAFTRFNFLMRRAFFRLMHRDLNVILDGLRELEQRGVAILDCRKAEFSADEPVVRLRMICQSWKVMFQAEYCSGQPLRLLADLRAVVDSALAEGVSTPAAEIPAGETPAAETEAPRAMAAAASGGLSADEASSADHETVLGEDGEA